MDKSGQWWHIDVTVLLIWKLGFWLSKPEWLSLANVMLRHSTLTIFWKALLGGVYSIVLVVRKLNSWVTGKNSRNLELWRPTSSPDSKVTCHMTFPRTLDLGYMGLSFSKSPMRVAGLNGLLKSKSSTMLLKTTSAFTLFSPKAIC